MHRDDLMKPDLLSEVVLFGSGLVIFVLLMLVAAVALMHVAA